MEYTYYKRTEGFGVEEITVTLPELKPANMEIPCNCGNGHPQGYFNNFIIMVCMTCERRFMAMVPPSRTQ